MTKRAYRFPTKLCDGFVHFSGATHVWTFTLGDFADESEHIAITLEAMLRTRDSAPDTSEAKVGCAADLEIMIAALETAIARRDFGASVEYLNSYYIGRQAGCAEPQPIGDERVGRLATRLRNTLRHI